MPLDTNDPIEAGDRPQEEASGVAPAPQDAGRLRFSSLSAQLLLLTVLFVMLAEVLIFLPSLANFRVNWLGDRLSAARLASLAVEASPEGILPDSLRSELLNSAQVRAIAIKRADQREMLLPAAGELSIDETYDLRSTPQPNLAAEALARLELLGDAIATFFSADGRTIRVIGTPGLRAGPGANGDDFVEIILPEAPLKAAMQGYALDILGLSIMISIITAALVYFALTGLLVRPMARLTKNMLRFSQNPEDATRIISPSSRPDEIGIAERELAYMQRELQQLLTQKNRLAQLGLAVSKINHDLRNMLASAQLISDRLGALPDPAVQRFTPKLIASLGRAINLCSDTLAYGKTQEPVPRRELFVLTDLVEEVTEGLGLPSESIAFRLEMDRTLQVDADRDQLYRVFNNLCRNAAQALENQGTGAAGEIVAVARRNGRRVVIEVRDNGPGIPEQARSRLFQPFQATARKGGTGLGLAVTAELVSAHGGQLRLLDATRGSVFQFEIPDRATLELI